MFFCKFFIDNEYFVIDMNLVAKKHF